MNATTPTENRLKTAAVYRGQLEALRGRCEDLPEIANREAMPRIERLDTMISALERDVTEVNNPEGADAQTVSDLSEVVETELGNLIPEMEALLQGNPTTVSAVFDASLNAVEKASEKIKEVTSKIPKMK
ncbi:MAG: hypothetical protein P1U58_07520 [Verrucomicrobiales bacterium]|nr:hypothetical protein [Verrucomicrobiales bacterium]